MPPKLSVSDFHSNIVSPYRQPGYLSPGKAELLTLDIIDLLSDAECEPLVLKQLAKFLTVETYVNLMDERTINHLCGYPACAKSPERSCANNPLRVLSSNMKMYNENPLHKGQNKAKLLTPFSYLNNYCSKEHYQCSSFYQTQLSDDALFTRENLFEDQSDDAGDDEVDDSEDEFNEKDQIHNRKGKKNIILLEEVWARQAKNNQLSLVDVLQDMNLKHEDDKENSTEKNSKAGRIVPDELMKDTVVEKFPTSTAGEELDLDSSLMSIEDQSKLIEGYVTET